MTQGSSRMMLLIKAVICLSIVVGSVYGLSRSWNNLPPFALWLDVWHGVYATARSAEYKKTQEIIIPSVSAPVQVVRDERGVPHIFAQNDNDAYLALGYIMASDRLFQMDLYRRAAAGKLAEIVGESMVENDKALRRTGMYLGAQKTNEALKQENSTEYQAAVRFSQGVNAYISSLSDHELPFECRLLGYRPKEWDTYSTCLILQYMSYDLTFSQGDISDAVLYDVLGEKIYNELYPEHSLYPVPHNPEPQGVISVLETTRRLRGMGAVDSSHTHADLSPKKSRVDHAHSLSGRVRTGIAFAEYGGLLKDFYRKTAPFVGEEHDGKGSNNWVVTGSKTQSGRPILSGDPHLALSLPAIWYEVQIVTPTNNVYGVTIPGAPGIIIGSNKHCAWTFTNTGADVMDFYTVEFDPTKKRYRHDSVWRDTREDIYTLKVKNAPDLRDTIRYTHQGPIIIDYRGKQLALQWTAHSVATTLKALWRFNHAQNYREFEAGMKYWNVPAQNIAYADSMGNISLRTCGTIPLRRSGTGKFITDGATNEGEWIGAIPYDSMPASINPQRDWLASANQEPVPPSYPYFLLQGWGFPHRGMRIQEMLEYAQGLTADSMRIMQTDVKVMQFAMMKPHLQQVIIDMMRDTQVKQEYKNILKNLIEWNGIADKGNMNALFFMQYMALVKKNTFDEIPDTLGYPTEDVLFRLLDRDTMSIWFDLRTTDQRETASDIMKLSLRGAIDSTIAEYGTNPKEWRWSNHHQLVIRHVLRDAMRPLGRYNIPFEGYASTVLPASGLRPTATASWRMVADYSRGAVQLYGVYPGGVSGNPANSFYTHNLQAWLQGDLYVLNVASTPQDIQKVTSTIMIR